MQLCRKQPAAGHAFPLTSSCTSFIPATPTWQRTGGTSVLSWSCCPCFHVGAQVSQSLSMYQGLGLKFAALAAEYGSVRKQVAEAQRLLVHFAAFEAELNEQEQLIE